MNLNELIGYYTAKLAYPDLTQHSRNIATDTLNELVRLSRLEDELQEAYNASNILLEANKYFGDEHRRYLAEVAVKDKAVADLRLENEEMSNYIADMVRRHEGR